MNQGRDPMIPDQIHIDIHSRSALYPNRKDRGVRLYLSVKPEATR